LLSIFDLRHFPHGSARRSHSSLCREISQRTTKKDLQHEREAISERTKAALQAAKRRGVKLGGPRLAGARKASIKVRSEAADAFAANVRPISSRKSKRAASAASVELPAP
jgi:hypothetical protein